MEEVKIITTTVTDNTGPGDYIRIDPQLENSSISWGSAGSYPSAARAFNPHAKELQVLTLSSLAGEAGQVSLGQLASIWRARWGDNWVKRGEIEGEFYEVAAARLHASARLEGHVLADGTQVFRLDEE